jgi:putative acetyltransferase
MSSSPPKRNRPGTSQFQILAENPEDAPSIRRVLEAAFGRSEEANLVEALRRRGAVTLSLVASQKNRIIGHLLFSPVIIKSPWDSFPAVGLGPVGVFPLCQNKGVGTALIRSGLKICQQEGHLIAVVLGDPDYYARFGFATAADFGLRCEFGVPEQFFMALELQAGALQGNRGVVIYPDELYMV